MKLRDTMVGVLIGLGTAAIGVQAAAPNWLLEAMAVRLPQSEIVRHPINNGKYYLCWTDGTNRYGVGFSRTKLDQQIRSIPRASRRPVAAMMTPGGLAWTAADEKICWPKK